MMKLVLSIYFCILIISCHNKQSEYPVEIIQMRNLESYPIVRLKSVPISLEDNFLAPYKIWVNDTLLVVNERVVDNTDRFLKFYSLKSKKMICGYGEIGRGRGEYLTPVIHWEESNTILITEKMKYTIFSYDSLFCKFDYMPRKLNVRKGLSAVNCVYRINDSVFFENSTMSDYQFSLLNMKSDEYVINYKNYPSIIKDNNITDFIANSNIYRAIYCLKSISRDSVAIAYELFPVVDLVSLKDFGAIRIQFPIDGLVNVVTVMDKLNAKIDNKKLYYIQSFITDNHIYLMYSGEMVDRRERGIPEIHQFDWQGNFIQRYQLDRFVDCFCVDKSSGKIYGVGLDSDKNSTSILVEFEAEI